MTHQLTSSASPRGRSTVLKIAILFGVVLLASFGWYMVTSSDLFQSSTTFSDIRSNRRPVRRFETASTQQTRHVGASFYILPLWE